MNGLRINNMNNLDDLIMNQGYMSERTKSPRRVNQNMAPNPYFQPNDPYHNVNKLNSNRDMSPNKIIAKNKPLLGNLGNANTMANRMPQITSNNFNQIYQAPFNESQNRHVIETKAPQQNNAWKNIKSPRSQQQQQMQPQSYGNQMNGTRSCSNHPGRKAEYMAQTDGEYIYYCETCAAKLAAQRFEVIKLPGTRQGFGVNNHFGQVHRPKLTYKRRQIPCLPQYKGNQIYESIIEFLKDTFTVEQVHFQTYQQLQNIEEHYEHQIEMVDEFYNQLEDILVKMHQDHISDMQKQHKKHAQMKDIFMNEIYQNLSAIDQIVNDLDQNFAIVVSKITNEEIQYFNEALIQNRSKINFYCSQIEQHKDMLNEVVTYKEERLMGMIEDFEKCLVNLWEEPKEQKPEKFSFQKNAVQPMKQPTNYTRQQQQQNMQFNAPVSSNKVLQPHNRQTSKNQPDQKLNVLQMHHQNAQKPGLVREFEGKGACRQIFDDDQQDENLTQQVSPKFKNI